MIKKQHNKLTLIPIALLSQQCFENLLWVAMDILTSKPKSTPNDIDAIKMLMKWLAFTEHIETIIVVAAIGAEIYLCNKTKSK